MHMLVTPIRVHGERLSQFFVFYALARTDKAS